MKVFAKTDDYLLLEGSMLNMDENIAPNSIDSIITDPPYGLTSITKRFGKENSAPAQYGKDGAYTRLSKGFMGKEWDGTGIEYNVDAWRKCYDALKDGGYLLAFGGSRTFHRIACAIEDAGFEIRDTIMWLYGSGFPKSLNIGLAVDKRNGVESKVVGNGESGVSSRTYQSEKTTTAGNYDIKQAQNEWNGWGTQLKPSFEPIIVARKPFKTSVAENIMQNGVGGINIDECRVPSTGEELGRNNHTKPYGGTTINESNTPAQNSVGVANSKRFPANVIHDESEEAIEAMGEASRYFYCAKASTKDRDEGLKDFQDQVVSDGCIRSNLETARTFGANSAPRKNIHPTVKPCELMQYLIRLVTPKGGTILDPFNGSGSTGKAAIFENRERNANYKYIGIEIMPEYLLLSKSRIDYAINKYEYDKKEEIKKTGIEQLKLF